MITEVGGAAPTPDAPTPEAPTPEAPTDEAPSTPAAAPRPAFPRAPSLPDLFAVAFGLFGFVAGLHRLGDNSFFWHLRTGALILDRGVPHADPYSFTEPGTRWIAQSWLAELAYGVVDRALGPFGLRLLTAATIGAVAYAMFRLAYRFAQDLPRAVLCTGGAIACSYPVWSARPLMLGALAMILLVFAVEADTSLLGRHPYVTLPVLFVLWTNVHGTFMLGYVYLGAHLVGRALEGHPPTRGRERRLLGAAAVGVACSLVNPYGPALLWFPVHLMARGNVLAGVSEWLPPDLHTVAGRTFAIWVVALVVVLARKHAGRRDLLVSLTFLLLAMYAVRNVVPFALVTLPVVARLVRRDPRPVPRRPLHWLLLAALVGFGAVVTVSAAQQPDFAFDNYPVAAWQAMQDQGLAGSRVFTTDADAGFLILQSWRENTVQPVFMDDRYDMYSEQLNADYRTAGPARPGWDEALDRHQVDTVMLPNTRPLVQVLALDPRWVRVHQDKAYTVYRRADSVPAG